MKYYLETNALRALGGKLHNSEEVLSKSFTSRLAIFELIKGIDKSKDSEKRLNILKSITKTNLVMINMMPIEFIESAFLTEVEISESVEVSQAIENFIQVSSKSKENTSFYLNLVKHYEKSTKTFQEKMSKIHCIPAPEPKTIKVDLVDLFAEPELSPELSKKNQLSF